MDFKISEKEERLQPEGLVQVYVNDVFDIYPTIDENNFITNIEIITDEIEDLKQGAVFASLKQLGSDPLSKADGVRWAEVMMEEIQTDVLMMDIQTQVRNVSTSCAVVFNVATGSDGKQYLTYDVKVVL